jgi:multiple sugar transport system ATP-binding protein
MNAHPDFMRASAGGAGSSLELLGICKNFGPVAALQSVSLTVRPGEVLAVTGPSGAGKTTLCRVVAGLETLDKGHCRIADRDVDGVSAGRRRVAYMFESYALYPHMTVRDNAMSPLLAPNGRGRDDAAVDALLELLEIRHLGARLPSQLSGGQKQRAALARVLVQQPLVTLLDEPISHLDAQLQHKLRREIRNLVTSRPSPTVWCTPDAMEALSVGDRVAVIAQGAIEQIGTPEEIWARPASVRVARLVGDPPMNLLPGHLAEGSFVGSTLRVALPPQLAKATAHFGGRAVLGVRADLLDVVPAGAPDAAPASAAAEVYSYEPFGKYAVVSLRLGDAIIKAKTRGGAAAAIGAAVGLVLPPSGFVLFEADSGKIIAADEADPHTELKSPGN